MAKKDVLSLALALIKKTDDQKAKDKVAKEVKKNQNQWRNDIFAMEEAADSSKETYEGLLSNTTVSAAQLLDAKRSMDLAAKNLADAQALASERFAD